MNYSLLPETPLFLLFLLSSREKSGDKDARDKEGRGNGGDNEEVIRFASAAFT